MKKLKIVFNNNNKKQELLYRIVFNPVSERWIKKIKHLSKIQHSIIETTGINFAEDIIDLHKEFCNLIKIDYKETDYNDQNSLNKLHELYEKNHYSLSGVPNNNILYKFHNAIHEIELKNNKLDAPFFVGWGANEGPLTEKFLCNEFYEKTMLKNNLYLPWSELGKRPMIYYLHKEPSNLDRLCELAKPHITLRAKFQIALKNTNNIKLPDAFEKWFAPFKQKWLDYYKIKDWRVQDEHAGVLLAEPEDSNMDIKQVLQQYPNFHSIELV